MRLSDEKLLQLAAAVLADIESFRENPFVFNVVEYFEDTEYAMRDMVDELEARRESEFTF